MKLYLLASLAGSTALALGAAGATPTDPQAPPPGFGCHTEGGPSATGAVAKLGLVTGLGDGGYVAEHVGPAARPYFEEGVRLVHDFDAGDAVRAFKAAQALQPDCALCFWGEAWARGPTINYGVDAKTVGEARAAALKARTLSTGLSDKAKALIDAAVARYPEHRLLGPPSDDRAYATAMDRLADRFPTDDALGAEAASALLIASGRAWSEGTPKPGSDTARAQARLETVLARSPTFTPAIHFYIHLMEWTHSPEKAAPYAERLAGLAPNAGHLVHMPSHLWFRLGRYQEGAVANLQASEADARDSQAFKTDGGVANFALHAHNVSFGLASALMSGDRDGALSLARQATAEFPDKGIVTKAYQAFGREASLAEAMAVPEPKSVTDKALWRYARALALVRAGDAAGARREATAFAAATAARGNDPRAKDGLLIAKDELDGRVALLEKRYDGAVAALRQAADRRDRVDTSLDPPDWGWPPRRALAAALLLKGDRAGAMRELEASLKRFPNDPMALYALSEAKRGVGDAAQADRLLAQAKAGWKGDPKDLRLDRV